MYVTRVLVANEPRSYREALARVFKAQRPEVEVCEIEPEKLDQEMSHFRPDLVVCSQATFVVQSCVTVWVELYPNCGTYSRVSIRGESTTVEEMQLTDLLALLDQTRDLTVLG